MDCPKCGAKMEQAISDCCSAGCCGVSSKPILTCPNCGYTEE